MSDDFEETEFEDEDFQESPEVNSLTRYEEIVFCPQCDVYMPYKVDGAIVRRKCPNCAKEFEGGREVEPLSAKGSRGAAAARPGTARPVVKAVAKSEPSKEDATVCQALTKAGTPCSNPPRAGSKYCSSHRGYRPPGKK